MPQHSTERPNMPLETSPRFNPRPTLRPKEPAPPIPEVPKLAKWSGPEPAAYVDGMNWYNAPPANPINALNPLGIMPS